MFLDGNGCNGVDRAQVDDTGEGVFLVESSVQPTAVHLELDERAVPTHSVVLVVRQLLRP